MSKYESLSEDELAQLKYQLGREKDAIREQMKEVDAVWSKKILMRNIQAKLTESEMCALGIKPATVQVEPVKVDVAAK